MTRNLPRKLVERWGIKDDDGEWLKSSPYTDDDICTYATEAEAKREIKGLVHPALYRVEKI